MKELKIIFTAHYYGARSEQIVIDGSTVNDFQNAWLLAITIAQAHPKILQSIELGDIKKQEV